MWTFYTQDTTCGLNGFYLRISQAICDPRDEAQLNQKFNFLNFIRCVLFNILNKLFACKLMIKNLNVSL